MWLVAKVYESAGRTDFIFILQEGGKVETILFR